MTGAGCLKTKKNEVMPKLVEKTKPLPRRFTTSAYSYPDKGMKGIDSRVKNRFFITIGKTGPTSRAHTHPSIG